MSVFHATIDDGEESEQRSLLPPRGSSYSDVSDDVYVPLSIKVRVMLTLVTVNLLLYLINACYMVYLPDMESDYFGSARDSLKVTSYYTAVSATIGVFFSFLYAALSDTYGRRSITICLSFLVIPPTISIALLPTHIGLYLMVFAVCTALSGAFLLAVNPTISSCISDIATTSFQKSLFFSLYQAAAAVGLLFSTLSTVLPSPKHHHHHHHSLNGTLDWVWDSPMTVRDIVFFTTIGASVLLCIAIMFLPETLHLQCAHGAPRRPASIVERMKKIFLSLKELGHSPTLLHCAVLNLLYSIPEMGLVNSAAFFLMGRWPARWTPADNAYLLGCIAPAMLLVFTVIGPAVRYSGIPDWQIATVSFVFLGLHFLWYAFAPSPLALFIGVPITAGAGLFASPMLLSVVARTAPVDKTGEHFGVMGFMQGLSRALGPLMFGLFNTVACEPRICTDTPTVVHDGAEAYCQDAPPCPVSAIPMYLAAGMGFLGALLCAFLPLTIRRAQSKKVLVLGEDGAGVSSLN